MELYAPMQLALGASPRSGTSLEVDNAGHGPISAAVKRESGVIIEEVSQDAVLDAAMDRAMHRGGPFYIRYMDYILILAGTRRTLRRVVRYVNAALVSLGLGKHPDKTFIGPISRGFDFLGYWFSPDGLSVARKTVAKFVEKASRLYEREWRSRRGSALEMYFNRWLVWGRQPLGGGSLLAADRRCLATVGQGCEWK
jgi:hypothetical protein